MNRLESLCVTLAVIGIILGISALLFWFGSELCQLLGPAIGISPAGLEFAWGLILLILYWKFFRGGAR